MRINKRILSIMAMSLLTFSTLSTFWVPLFQVSAQPMASLTGAIFDGGVDTDGDGTFDFLKVGVEVNVSTAGAFVVDVSGLFDSTYDYINVWSQNFTYLDVGIQVVYVSLDGPTIYSSGFNPANVSKINLYGEYYNLLDSLVGVSLSREYFYTEFDRPPASLTGTIYDRGVDTDGNGAFDYLEVGVEVNVSTPGTFAVEISGLLDSAYNYTSVWSQNFTYLDVDIQVVYLYLDGPSIYASGFNPASVSNINLYDEYRNQLGYLSGVPLSREYFYTEFDRPPASLTGAIFDGGVDTDGDGTFDFLKVGVEVNVSTAGAFVVDVSGLFDSTYDYINVWSQNSTYLDVGIQVVYVSLDGPSIYSSGFNPASVSDINLYDEYRKLGYLFGVPLSREYNYTEFDSPPPPPAFLTGTIAGDRGVDIDGDGAFDYLEVGVKVNVTDSGEYRVEIKGLLDSGYNNIGVSGYKSEYLNAGVQVVNVSLYGPTIYVSGKNPMNISDISLYSVEYAFPFTYIMSWLGSVNKVPLFREYLHTEFDSPFADAEAIFVVYPDGRIVMGGTLNYTHMEPPNTGPSIYGVVNIEKIGTTTGVSASFTLIPPEDASQFPFNSSDFTLLSQYSGGLLTTTISGSTIFPPSIASEFPFNATDFIVMGEHVGNMVTGNITVDILPGFPLDDIKIDFQGNNTYVHIYDSLKVIYGIYPDLGEINATVLDNLLQQLNSTIPGKGSDSLYNMTQGLFECTRLNTTTTPYNAIGATVDFEAEIQGDFIQTLVGYLMANITDPSHPLYRALNETLSSFETASLQLAYAHDSRQAYMNLVFTVNMTKLIDSMVPILPEIPDIPPEMVSLIESILNTTYCTVNSAQVSLNYENGQATLTATATIQDDFNAEINYIKSMFLIYGDVPQPLTSQLQTVNETQIDLTNFRMSLNLTETTLEADVSGFAVLPPLDVINATSFKLERFFNITASEDEPPREGEKLKVTVEGGSNATHTVTIFRPLTVPEPDLSASREMIWYNQSISELKDLIFQIEGDSTPPVIGTPVHTPEIPGPGEAVTVSVNVTDAATGVRPDGVTLSYRTNGGAWNNVTMSKTTGDTYEGIIPGLPAGTQVEYIIIAYDNANNEAVKDKAGAYYVYFVIPEFPTWQIMALTLLLIGIIVVIMKRRPNIRENSLTTNQFFSIFAGNPVFH